MRLLICSIAVVFLVSLAGCKCGSSGCTSSDCGTGGCKSGIGGCNTGGCKGGVVGRWMHSHGICDCEVDDYCTSRSPWIRTGATMAPPVETIPAPSVPAKLPDGKTKKL